MVLRSDVQAAAICNQGMKSMGRNRNVNCNSYPLKHRGEVSVPQHQYNHVMVQSAWHTDQRESQRVVCVSLLMGVNILLLWTVPQQPWPAAYVSQFKYGNIFLLSCFRAARQENVLMHQNGEKINGFT